MRLKRWLAASVLAVSVLGTGGAAQAAAPRAPYGGYDEAAQPGNRVVRILGVPVRPCVYEDGSGGPLPCYWDARLRGNHHGHSLWVDRRRHFHYVSGLRAFYVRWLARGWHRSAPYDGHRHCVVRYGDTSWWRCYGGFRESS